jgi:hypothetical protein
LAYVADSERGLQIVDISSPSLPVIIGSADTPGTAKGVAIAGTTALVADLTAGVQVVDVSAPSTPVVTGGFDTPGSALGIVVANGLAYRGRGRGARPAGTAGMRPDVSLRVGFTGSTS